MIKKIFLTGKTSFIGSNIYEFLSKNSHEYSIFAPSHLELDLVDEKSLRKIINSYSFDCVIHAAMYNDSFNHPKMLSESLKIFYNLQKYSNYYGKMYYFGSGAEFDKTLDIIDISENDFGRSIPQNYYGYAKYIMNKEAIKSNNIYNLRLFGVYGKNEDYKTKFISNAICRALFDLPININQNVFFDYLYINDLCNIVNEFIRITPKYHDYNICSGKKYDLISLGNKVLNINPKHLDIVVEKDGLNKEYTASNERMLTEISNRFTDIDIGIESLYNWYKKNIHLIEF